MFSVFVYACLSLFERIVFDQPFQERIKIRQTNGSALCWLPFARVLGLTGMQGGAGAEGSHWCGPVHGEAQCTCHERDHEEAASTPIGSPSSGALFWMLSDQVRPHRRKRAASPAVDRGPPRDQAPGLSKP